MRKIVTDANSKGGEKRAAGSRRGRGVEELRLTLGKLTEAVKVQVAYYRAAFWRWFCEINVCEQIECNLGSVYPVICVRG